MYVEPRKMVQMRAQTSPPCLWTEEQETVCDGSLTAERARDAGMWRGAAPGTRGPNPFSIQCKETSGWDGLGGDRRGEGGCQAITFLPLGSATAAATIPTNYCQKPLVTPSL